MRRSILLVAILALAPVLLWTDLLARPIPEVYSVMEGRGPNPDQAVVVVIGKKVTKFKLFELKNTDGTDAGVVERTFKSKTMLVFQLPEELAAGEYDLKLFYGKDNSESQTHRFQLTNGVVVPSTLTWEYLAKSLQDHIDNAALLSSGTLSTDRYSAYDDLTQESKIGGLVGQVAAGNHGHPEFATFVRLDGDSMTGPLQVELNPGQGNNAFEVNHDNPAGGDIADFRSAGTAMARILKNGTMTIVGTLTEGSDARLKTDVAALTGVLPRLQAVRAVTYRFKDGCGPDGRHLGLLAQEVREAFPELVCEDADGKLSVAYGKLSAVLLQAVKEQQATIDSQRDEIERLRTDLKEARQDLGDRLARLEKLLD